MKEVLVWQLPQYVVWKLISIYFMAKFKKKKTIGSFCHCFPVYIYLFIFEFLAK